MSSARVGRGRAGSRTGRLRAAGLAAVALVLPGLAGVGYADAAARPLQLSAKTGAADPADKVGRMVKVQVLSFNDFHGNLEPPQGSSGRVIVGHTQDATTGAVSDATVDAGGVAYLATHLRDARAGQRYTVTVAAGDIIGASPFLSAAFHDEPTIEAMNALGLEATAVGNHEFDEGYQELQRMRYGGCIADGTGANNQNSCPDGTFQGSAFPFLAANVKYSSTPHTPRSGKTILPPYWVKDFGNGVRIGFIGMTLKDTPTIVTQSGVAGLTFTDEVSTANKLVPKLAALGVNAIVVLIHQGGVPGPERWKAPDGKTYSVNASYDETCAGGGRLTSDSAILPIARNLSPAIDMVVSGHTHQPYVCSVQDPAGHKRLVTSASSFSRLYTETTLTYDRTTHDVVRSSVRGTNMVATRDITPAPDEQALIDRYTVLAAPIASRQVGTITADITRSGSAAGESPLGDVIADAQLADDTVVHDSVAPVVAFMNPGGIRAELTYPSSAAGEGDGVVRFDEAFTVQPFSNYLVSMDLTGADVYDLLEQQWSDHNAGTARKILQVSDTFRYSWSEEGGTPHVVPGSVTIQGATVADDASQTYRVVCNSFLSDGGDNFAAFRNGTDKLFGGQDLDAFTDYIDANSPLAPPALGRITKVG